MSASGGTCRPDGRCRTHSGFTLIELLVAMALASVLLASAWSWLLSVWDASSAAAGRGAAATTAAYAVRSVAADLRTALALETPPGPVASSLAVLRREPATATETVLVAWDPGTRVLWRKTRSTYVADHVSAFAMTYYGADGEVLPAEDLAAAMAAGGVARVRVTVEVSMQGGSARADADVVLGRWG